MVKAKSLDADSDLPSDSSPFLDNSDPVTRISGNQAGGATHQGRKRAPRKTSCCTKCCLISLGVFLLLLLLIILVVPWIIYFSSEVREFFVFRPGGQAEIDLNNPLEVGLQGGLNFYVESEHGISIGVWHILPQSLVNASKVNGEDYWKTELKNSGKPVVIYCHGNGGTRAAGIRPEVYGMLQNLDYHVIAFDYRSFSDSSEGPLHEAGVVADTRAVYDWVVQELGLKSKVPIYFWGHSLGAAIVVHLAADLSNEGKAPAGLFLEGAFTNLADEVRSHPLTWVFRILPYFDYTFIEPLKEAGIEFESDRHIKNITSPIVIFHSLGDHIVPFELGQNLFKIGFHNRPPKAKPIYFKDFEEEYMHAYICRSPELPSIVKDFVNSANKDSWPCKSLELSTTRYLEEQDYPFEEKEKFRR